MVETASRVDVAILKAEQHALGNGRWLYRIKVQRRGEIPVPIELLADGETIGVWESRGRETTKTFTAVRDKKFAAVWLGPDWLRFMDSDVSNNARVADGSADYKPAVVTAARWTLYAEELVRTYAGVAR